jgi:hypothetical protein
MTPNDVVSLHVNSWGPRDIYVLSKEEFEILFKDRGEVELFNVPNDDGTFFSQLTFDKKKFCYSGSEKIDG